MQKLKQRTEKNTPMSTPLAHGNCGLQLNREETLSVVDLKTCFNNPEVDLPSHTKGLIANVYVISIDGKPLMPCSPAKARKLLKSERAVVVKLYHFTIKLTFKCENITQGVTLGIDTGFQNIGFSCVTDKKELTSGTLILDGKTSERLTEKAMYRRLRRNKLWYREPRFLNRSKPKGWLPPSIQRRYDTHLTLINRLKAILPISKVNIEIASFDIQKILNPEIQGKEYQQGSLYEYQNMRSYLMARERGKCQLCGKEFGKGNGSHIHHCKPRSESGSNRPKNLAILHKKCHEKLHKNGLKLKAAKQYKAPTFLSIINNRFSVDLPEAEITYGYETFIKRNEIGLEKTHFNDAFVIASGKKQERCLPIEIKQKHRNNRAIQTHRKGFKPAIRKRRYKIQPMDVIWVGGQKYISSGVQNKGKYVGVKNSKKVLPFKNIEKIYNFGSFAWK